ncbi:MAG TPA: alpha-amylase/4-alpha-glucanotransferase domain-containing protein [Pirellulales bacterium]|jgi:alpha-amylase|nr:alpha-amylase/4-alpha-glucanotransferase domain-containing protein [Pirellulales bacterium]
MAQPLRFALVFHNHQPIGNFDGVIEQAYQDSYLPFLDVFCNYPTLKIGLHTSGCLMEWLAANHPEYLDRLGELVADGRVEIVGGAFYEPILPMLPRRDRVGQIVRYRDWLESRLGAKVRGMWIPERVWEQSLTSDLALAGVEYTILDDFHFKCAGLTQDQLHGYYVTEDDGRLLSVFPGSERLRYTIPFADPQETIDYLGQIAHDHPGSVVVFGDDGEKFGTWPDTKKHVYEHGWLRQFFDRLVDNQHWINVTTLSEAIDNVPPTGKVYLPDSSYREMTEWALPAEQLVKYETVRHDMEHEHHWPVLQQFLRGGFWRNFKVKYPETDEMYTRMLMISRRLEQAVEAGHDRELLDYARTELYRGQCNCSYWHGAFGGCYLPHLRNAVYKCLIAADNLLNRAADRSDHWVEATAGDFNLDARQEIFLANDRLATLLSPYRGGQMYELDVRSICHNLLATLARRPEAYHRKVLAGAGGGGDAVASIHDRVVFKQPGLEERVQYDSYNRKSLLDHFYDNDATLATVVAGKALERGDFMGTVYEARLRRNPDRIQAQMTRAGNAWGIPLKITKGVTLEAGSNVLEIAYMIEGLPQGRPLHFAVEFNFAGMPSGADDRYFHDGRRNRLGQLGTQLDLHDITALNLVDEWLGIDVGFQASIPTQFWTFPIETVSQSEGGFELVHQSVAVLPHWLVEADANGRWSVMLNLSIDTTLAESRMNGHRPHIAGQAAIRA